MRGLRGPIRPMVRRLLAAGIAIAGARNGDETRRRMSS